MRKEKEKGKYNKRETENQSRLTSLEFDVLDFKYEHFNDDSLLKLKIIIDGKEYIADLLIGDFEYTYYPEFRKIDGFKTLNGDVIVSNFIKTFEKKVNHFASNYSKKIKKQKGMNSWDYQEWWQVSEMESTINEGINDWILSNREYLNEYVSHKEGADDAFNEAVEELQEYLTKRSTFKVPTGFDVFKSKENDISSLEAKISKAIKEEDFETASDLRDKIKNMSKNS